MKCEAGKVQERLSARKVKYKKRLSAGKIQERLSARKVKCGEGDRERRSAER